MHRLVTISCSLAAFTLFCGPGVQGATIVTQVYSGSYPATISGTLANQNTALEETFSLTSTSDLTIFTSSYASGGFEPNITLYNASGTYITSSVPPGSFPGAKIDPTTGLALDTGLSEVGLTPGKYTVALTDWELNQSPTATNLSDGFNTNYGSGTTFVDVAGNIRTGNYALVITSTPEPSTIWLGAGALLAGLLSHKWLGFLRSNSPSRSNGESTNV